MKRTPFQSGLVEETITHIHMLMLRRTEFLTFKQTPLRHEPEFGTDFESWVGAHGVGWIGYAMQAKKLDFKTKSYRTLVTKLNLSTGYG